MKRYKYLSECKDGDWVYYDCGKLVQVCTSDWDPDPIQIINDVII